MSKICFALCAALCFATALLHEVIGGSVLLASLLDSSLDVSVKGMFLLSWHRDTVLLLGLASLFGCAAFVPNSFLIGIIATGMSVALGTLMVGMATFYVPAIWDSPGPILWCSIPLVGIVGVISGWKRG